MADKSDTAEGLLALFALLLLVLLALYSGFTLATLWGWFVVPTFGVPTLTTSTATGLILVVGTIRARVDVGKKDEPGAAARAVVSPLMVALGHTIALLLGAVLHAFQI